MAQASSSLVSALSTLSLSVEDAEEPNHVPTSPLFISIEDEEDHAPHSLAALDALSSLDTDSDSDILPLPGMPTTQSYPNCCRWHLTDARCRYKWRSASICAPFSVRVASTNFYSSADGMLNSHFGPGIRLHSPIIAHMALVSHSIIASPTLDAQVSPPSPTTSESSPSITPPTVDNQIPPVSPVAPELSQQRWYAITKGRSICVVHGWSNARPLISIHPDGTAFAFSSEASAITALKEEVARGRVEILDYMH